MSLIPRTCLVVLCLQTLPFAAISESARSTPAAAPTEARPSRISTRADSVLPLLRERRPDLAWAATATWTDARGRPLAPAQRRREAVRTALRLRDTRNFREAAAFAMEIDTHLATAENALPQALSEQSESKGSEPPQESKAGAEQRAELAAILDLRATIAVGFEMDTARARELRRRSAELAPERLPRRPARPKPAEPEAAAGTAASAEGGRP